MNTVEQQIVWHAYCSKLDQSRTIVSVDTDLTSELRDTPKSLSDLNDGVWHSTRSATKLVSVSLVGSEAGSASVGLRETSERVSAASLLGLNS